MGQIRLGLLLVFLIPLLSGFAQANRLVDLELVLAIDVSGSVFQQDYDLQVEGLSAAFRDPEVIAAIGNAGPNGVAVSVVQWSGEDEHIVAVDWTHLSTTESIAGFSVQLGAMRRRLAGGQTRIDAALLFSSTHFANNGFTSDRQVIDVSGDGGFESRGLTRAARDIVIRAGFVINALAVESEILNLGQFYADNVIGGVGSFVLRARDYEDFRRAIQRKLVLEITPLQISGHRPEDPGRN